MTSLINVLKNDRLDPDIIKAALETLAALCTSEDKKVSKFHFIFYLFERIKTIWA
jgi:hypothetical protein